MESRPETAERGWAMPLARWFPRIREREGQVFLALTLVIGALTGLAVVAFIVVTERLGMHLYPVGSTPWRRFFIPVLGSLAMGYLLYRYFPHARGSGVPQIKRRSSRGAGESRFAPSSENSFVPRQHLLVEFHLGVKALRCKSAPE